ncbi:hypothetical protein [Labilibaculum manganireducens]|uniref:hypothetical protein n=1 Tax=Labilibaculum manganireducens TaxID=1940525 RepID=UPI0029F57AE2|nr:hypothetical protein [Labilibaculum manganireducens]
MNRIIITLILSLFSIYANSQSRLHDHLLSQDSVELVGKKLISYFTKAQGEVFPEREAIIASNIEKKIRENMNIINCDSCSVKTDFLILSDTYDWHVKVVLSFKSGSVIKKYVIGEFRAWPNEEAYDYRNEDSRDYFKSIRSVILSKNEIMILKELSYADFSNDSEVIVSQDTSIVKF